MFSRLSSTLLVGTAVLGTAFIGLGSGSAKAVDIVCDFDNPSPTQDCGSTLFTQGDTSFMGVNYTSDINGSVNFPGTVTFTPSNSITVTYAPPVPTVADLAGSFDYVLKIVPPSTDVFTSVTLSNIVGDPGVTITKTINKFLGFDPITQNPNLGDLLGTITATAGGSDSLSILFSADITDIYVSDMISGTGSITSYTNSYTQYPKAPAPLPLLGAGAAFGFTRRLRRRTRTRLTLV
jgi:hypothetical protein